MQRVHGQLLLLTVILVGIVGSQLTIRICVYVLTNVFNLKVPLSQMSLLPAISQGLPHELLLVEALKNRNIFTSVVEYWSSMSRALGSVPSTTEGKDIG